MVTESDILVTIIGDVGGRGGGDGENGGAKGRIPDNSYRDT